jgi:hypothetical protein
MAALGRLDSAVSSIPNFTPSGTFITAAFKATTMTVLLGTKTPGTPTPMVVGLDPTSQSVRWQVPLPVTDLDTVRDNSSSYGNAAVCGDRFIGTYGAGAKSWHVAAMDATSGVRQWDVVLKTIFSVDSLHGVVCSPTRVYIVREKSVDVLDAATGHAVGTIGAD